METNALKAGDIVRLKSGGPKMTIDRIIGTFHKKALLRYWRSEKTVNRYGKESTESTYERFDYETFGVAALELAA